MTEKIYTPQSLTKELFDKNVKVKGYIKKRSEHKIKKDNDKIIDYVEIMLEWGFSDKLLIHYSYDSPKELNKIDEEIFNKNLAIFIFEGMYNYFETKKDIVPILYSSKFYIENSGIDIDKITLGLNLSYKNSYKIVREVIVKLELEKTEMLFADIKNECLKHDIEELKTKKIIERLKQEAFIFEPRMGVYRLLR